MKGGRLLGQGSFGCTFDPAPRCAGGPVFTRINGFPAVGKITSEDSTQELEIGKTLMSLPMATAYFALPSKGCKPEFPIRDPDGKQCKVLQEDTDDENFSLLIMPNAGQTLLKYGMNLPVLGANLKRIFIHLLEGAIIYQNAGYVHNDIHMANILVDGIGVPRYIDVGLTFNVDKIKSWEDSGMGRTFKPKYNWQAPEVHTWRMHKSGIRLVDGVEQLMELNPEFAQMERRFPSRKRYLEAMTDFLRAVGRESDLGFLKTYAKQFDAWRIGLCLWFLWDDLLHSTSPAYAESAAYKERDVIRTVCSGLTDFDPRTRLTVRQALTLLDPANRLSSPR